MKTCSKCNQSLNKTEFGKRADRLQPWCKDCFNEYNQARYKSKTKEYKDKNRKRRLAKQVILRSYVWELMRDGCSVCGELDKRCLEFDHIDRSKKTFVISKAIADGLSLERVKQELENCRVLCANCHRKHTADQMDWYRNMVI